MYDNIKTSDPRFTQIMEVMLGVDEIQIDDNYLQISEFFARDRKFLNIKTIRMI